MVIPAGRESVKATPATAVVELLLVRVTVMFEVFGAPLTMICPGEKLLVTVGVGSVTTVNVPDAPAAVPALAMAREGMALT